MVTHAKSIRARLQAEEGVSQTGGSGEGAGWCGRGGEAAAERAATCALGAAHII